MASATLSALAGAFLSPLRDVSLEKLIGFLWDYLSSAPSPSSPDEAEKQQQLKDSLEALEDAKLILRLMQSRIMKLFEKHKQNERVVGLHNKLKDVGYDIQDLESEMEYMELERKVEEINNADQEADTITSRFSGKRLFPFRLPTAFLSKKKRRLPASSQSSSLSTADDDIVRQVTSIIKQINSIESKLKDEIKLEEWFDQIKLNGVYDPRDQNHFTQNKRVTTSSTNERKIYGRDDEIQRLIKFLQGPNANGNISVIPIVGLGGMGKTALAQSVFNDRQIENNFDKKVWVYVSDNFDRVRIIKEMADIISPTDQRCSTTSLDLLERELKRHLTGRKLLLVLDDVWSDEWQQLLSPLQSAQVIKIIVTCRDPKILGSVDKVDKIILEAAEDEPLPGIDGLQIAGEPFPGRTLQACGYSINGTTSCNFEWVRYLENGAPNYIEGAKQPKYLVTADDVDTVLAIEVQPLDNRKRKGEIVTVLANDGRRITCDAEMKDQVERAYCAFHASFEVLISAGALDIWEPATLAIKRDGYSIKCNGPRGVVVEEKFQPAVAITIPFGQANEFAISSTGGEYLLRAAETGVSRDTIVLTMRMLKMRAVEKRKGRR